VRDYPVPGLAIDAPPDLIGLPLQRKEVKLLREVRADELAACELRGISGTGPMMRHEYTGRLLTTKLEEVDLGGPSE
jgi:hypothetical protein